MQGKNGKCHVCIPKTEEGGEFVYKANVAFTVFAPDLLLSFYGFATYLKREN